MLQVNNTNTLMRYNVCNMRQIKIAGKSQKETGVREVGVVRVGRHHLSHIGHRGNH